MKKILMLAMVLGLLVSGCAHINQVGRNYLSNRIDPESIVDVEKFRNDNGECCDKVGNIRSYIIFADFVPATVYYDSCMKGKGYKIRGELGNKTRDALQSEEGK